MDLTTPPSILIATLNQGKVDEFRDMLPTSSFKLLSLEDFPNVVEVDEVGQSFRENAILKARGYAAQTGHFTLADDSGLEVAALDGAPGILSARYGGDGASDADRINKLLIELSATGDKDRRARFVCVIAIFDPTTNNLRTFAGKCEGQIAHVPTGAHGFGYDPIFVPDGFAESFGCLATEIKQTVSHRGRAMSPARVFLKQLFDSHA